MRYLKAGLLALFEGVFVLQIGGLGNDLDCEKNKARHLGHNREYGHGHTRGVVCGRRRCECVAGDQPGTERSQGFA